MIGGETTYTVSELEALKTNYKNVDLEKLPMAEGYEYNNLYGGDGDDLLIDSTGEDRLEGGNGNDTLIFRGTNSSDIKGGNGYDTYALLSNANGVNTRSYESYRIDDSDGYGKVVYQGEALYGSTQKPVSNGVWIDSKGNRYSWDGAENSTLTINDKIQIRNFENGALGITLCRFPNDSIKKVDPLVIDLDGDGIELTSIAESNAHFDLNSDGIREKVQWIKPDDGILVLDKNANGEINGIDELFGNPNTIGFEDLAQYDSNEDNVIDSNDTKFGQMKVWQDLNSNGKVDPNELKTLSELNISKINLNYNSAQDETFAESSTIEYSDGSTGLIQDINLEVDYANTVYEKPTQIPTDIEALPQIIGSGIVKDLYSSMIVNDGLKTFVSNLSTKSAFEIYSDMDDLLKIWSRNEAISNDEMRGICPKYIANIVEKFYNNTYTSPDATSGEITDEISRNDIRALFINNYNQIKNNAYTDIIIQTGKFACLSGITYSDSTNSYTINSNTETMSQSVATFIQTASESDVAVLSIVLDKLRREYLYDFDMNSLSENISETKKLLLSEASLISFDMSSGMNDLIVATKDGLTINDDGGNDIYLMKDGNNVITDIAGSNTYYMGSGNDNITDSGSGASIVHAGSGNDIIKMSGYGQSEIYGEAGDDTITASGKSTTISGGTGNDTITTSRMDTTYIFNLGDGQDTVISTNDSRFIDKIKFGSGITWNDLEFEKQTVVLEHMEWDEAGQYDKTEENMVIKIKGTNDQITIKYWFGGKNNNDIREPHDYKIEKFEFADGTTRTPNDIFIELMSRSYIEGTDDSDILTGTAQNDVFYGKAGDDIITDSYSSNDLYLFGKGSGNDVITDNEGSDIIKFTDNITQGDIVITKVINDLLIGLKVSDDSIRIKDWGNSYGNQIEKFEFADGSVMTNINSKIQNFIGSNSDDTIIGNTMDNLINGSICADTMIGDLGNDTYIVDNVSDNIIEYANEGIDTVISDVTYALSYNIENIALSGSENINATGNVLNNTLQGNSGNNILTGGSGNDTYLFGVNGGNDTISDTSGTDTISLDSSVDKSNVAVYMSGTDLVIDYGNEIGQDKVVVLGQTNAENAVEKIELSDGTFISNTDVNQLIQTMSAYAANNEIQLSNINDVKNNQELMTLVANSWHN